MKFLNKFIRKQIFQNTAQIIILFLLAILTSGIFFFVRFSIDKNELEINHYVETYQQEDVRFTLNLERISSWEDDYISYLSDKYHMQIEQRKFIKYEENDFTYYVTTPMKQMNITNVIEGNLPSAENEIAFPYKYLEQKNLHIGDEITLYGMKYMIVGSITLPDYILFQPYDELQKDYENNSFAMVTDDVYKSLKNSNKTEYYCGLLEENTKSEVLEQLRLETGIKNIEDARDVESDSAPLKAFRSNQSLAYTFLLGLTVVSAFVYYLFISKFIKCNRKLMGTLQALGYKNIHIIFALLFATIPILIVGGILGALIGGKLSMVLVKLYIETYMFLGFDTGISAKMLILGVMALPVVAFFVVNICAIVLLGEETAMLMRSERIAKESKAYNTLISWIIRNAKPENRFSYKTIFRKKSNIILTIVSMIAIATLFITSISLYFSSSIVQDKMFQGQEYEYCYTTNFYIPNVEGADCFQKAVASVELGGDKKNINVYGINHNLKYFHLYDGDNNRMNVKNGKIVISEGYAVIYNLKIGDNVELQVDGMKKIYEISGICQNGYWDSMYLTMEDLSSFIGTDVNTSNTFYSDKKIEIENSAVISILDERKAAEYNQSSNKSSAVINQVIGILFSILMFSLIMILIMDENKDNIRILELLGYTEQRANQLVLGKYRVFIGIVICITYPLALYVSYLIHLSISRSTNDYICFSSNTFVFIAFFICIHIIYSIVIGIQRTKKK